MMGACVFAGKLNCSIKHLPTPVVCGLPQHFFLPCISLLSGECCPAVIYLRVVANPFSGAAFLLPSLSVSLLSLSDVGFALSFPGRSGLPWHLGCNFVWEVDGKLVTERKLVRGGGDRGRVGVGTEVGLRHCPLEFCLWSHGR